MVQKEFKMGPQGELMVENSGSGIRKGFTEEIVFSPSPEGWKYRALMEGSC